MSNVPFWGKLRRGENGEVVAWLSVLDHCADVAAVFEALLASPVVLARLSALAGNPLTPAHVARLCVLATLHDAGKLNSGFNRKWSADARDVAGHVAEAFACLYSPEPEGKRFRAAIECREIVTWGAEHLLLASLAHHGKPLSIENREYLSRIRWWRPKDERDPFPELTALGTAARDWFPACRQECEPFSDEPAFQHGFSGLVTLADWIASDEELFPYEPKEASRINVARQRARVALRAIGLDARVARQALETDRFAFEKTFRFRPRPAQQAILSLARSDGGSLTILESETGSGKTEAALTHYLLLLQKGLVDGLYFALPTRTAATQIHERIAQDLERQFPDRAVRPPVVLAVPGYTRVDEVEGRREREASEGPTLAPFRVLWPDDAERYWHRRGWAAESAKRYLAGAVVVGTIDQVLLSALPVKHAHLRASSLLRHLLVVDEVHASDAYMNGLLETVLERHLAAGGHALLMSATLGSVTKARFLTTSPERRPPPLSEAALEPYPTITTWRPGDRPRTHLIPRRSEEDSRPKTIEVQLREALLDAQAIAALALAAAQEQARVLVIRNTVTSAVATQQAVEEAATGKDPLLLLHCGHAPAPHHSRYSRLDRIELDQALAARFGKKAPPGGCIAVATQTVQQSLDIDADLLITDLCPMDVLLQRMGRLHRHQPTKERPRPKGFETARTIVLVPEDRDLGRYLDKCGYARRAPAGIGTVYADLLTLQATMELLDAGRLEIPTQNRRLVEMSTHPDERPRLARALGPYGSKHETVVQGDFSAKAALAVCQSFSWSEPFGSCEFSDVNEMARTRLGLDDWLAPFSPPLASPFGKPLEFLTIPAWMAKGIETETAPSDIRVSGGCVRFRFGAKDYVYDRLGLRFESSSEDTSKDNGA